MKYGWPKSKVKSKGGEEKQMAPSKWLERIEVSIPILEIIDEKFFGISQFFTPRTLIFGSTVVSCVLGEPFQNDLDIAVSRNEYTELVEGLSNSPKWVQKKNSSLRSSAYGDSNLEARVQSITNFVSYGGTKVQVITSKQSSNDSLDDALTIVRGVDFSCCALAVDANGNLFETLRGAYDDCLAKKLKIVREKSELSYVALTRRIQKYTNRGFILAENYDSLLAELEKMKPQEKPKELIPDLAQLRSDIRKYFCLTRQDGRCVFFLNNKLYNRFPNTRQPAFIDFLYDTLYECYAAATSDVEGVDPQVVGATDGDNNSTFSFDPYYSDVDWPKFEGIVINNVAKDSEFFPHN